MAQDPLSNGLPLDHSRRAETNGLPTVESATMRPLSGGSGTAAAAADAPDPSIETRLRKGSSKDFAFDSLLDGVSTLNRQSADRRGPSETVQLPGMAASDDSLLSAPEFRHSVPPPQTPHQTPLSPETGKKNPPVPLLAGIGALVALLAIAALVVILQQGTKQQPVAKSASGAAASTAATAATATKRTPGHPDPALTPGERIGVVGRADRTPRPIPSEVRSAVLKAYGITAEDKRQVLCRLIPTSLGGTDSPKNLFPTTPWFSDLKTRLDRRLTQLVAEGKMSVEEAEKELTTDWIASSHRHYVRNYGENDSQAARKVEDTNKW